MRATGFDTLYGQRWIVAAIVAVMLVVGLKPDWSESAWKNGIGFPENPPGLEFADHGIAFSAPVVTSDDAREVTENGFTVEVVVELADPGPEGFACIVEFSDGTEESQWFLGQWKDSLVVMNGDDYSYERRLPRATFDASGREGEPFYFTVVSGPGGTELYVDGELQVVRPKFKQRVPAGARLSVGNSIFGTSPWVGTVGGLAFFKEAMSASRVSERFQQWRERGELHPSGFLSPWLCYPLGERSGTVVRDVAGRGSDLTFPPGAVYAERRVLAHDRRMGVAEQLTTRDAIVNFFGFMPFGWAMAGLLALAGPMPSARRVAIAVAAGFALSLGIELAQSWMVSRSSSLLDLALNTAGALAGALVALVACRLGEAPEKEAPGNGCPSADT